MSADTKTTNALLTAGMLAGPLYVLLWAVQAVVREGYDPTRHDLSLLSNGDLGWVQITSFILTGAIVIAGAIGMRRALRGGKGRTWAPILLALYGIGLIGAGIFVADPMNGFPLGTADGAPVNPTTSGLMHIVTGAFGFLGLIAACFVMARRFAAEKARKWQIFSIITGVVFFAGFAGIASSAQQAGDTLRVMTLMFTGAVLLAWAWLTAVSYKYITKAK